MNAIEIEKAKAYATEAHAGQTRKDGETPFIDHPEAVVETLKGYLYGEADELLPAAWLHDVVEDTDRTIENIRAEFDPTTADQVDWLTNPNYSKHKQKRYERKFYMRRRLSRAPFKVKQIKLADRLVNLQDLSVETFGHDFVRMYAMESYELVNAIIYPLGQNASVTIGPLASDVMELAMSYIPEPEMEADRV